MLINEIINLSEYNKDHNDIEPTEENLHKILDYYNIPKEDRLKVKYGSVLMPLPMGEDSPDYKLEVDNLLKDLHDKKFANKFLLAYSVGTENFGFGNNDKIPGVRVRFAKEALNIKRKTLYHVTKVNNLESIKKNGITATSGDYVIGSWTKYAQYNGAIFLTDNPDLLVKEMATELPEWETGKLVIFRVDVTGLDIHKDTNIAPDLGFNSYVTFESIPPERIKSVKQYKR